MSLRRAQEYTEGERAPEYRLEQGEPIKAGSDKHVSGQAHTQTHSDTQNTETQAYTHKTDRHTHTQNTETYAYTHKKQTHKHMHIHANTHAHTHKQTDMHTQTDTLRHTHTHKA